MFPCRARLRITTLQRFHRSYSTPANPYTRFEKLRAYPFAFNDYEAERLMAPAAAALCGKALGTSVLHRFLPWMELEYIKPKRILPIYFPAWIIDAEVQATVRYQGSERVASALLQNGYLPGAHFEAVSSVPLFAGEMADAQPLPWSDGLLQQQGHQITCVPYTIDPIHGLKAFSDLKFDAFPDLSASLSTIQPTLSVFRPVLLPLYLAQYEVTADSKTRGCTLFLDASQSSGSVYGVRLNTGPKDEYDEGIDHALQFVDANVSPNSDILRLGLGHNWVDVETVSLPPHRDISAQLKKWIEWRMYDAETAKEMAAATAEGLKETSGGIVEDKDARIREYDVEDRGEVEEWMGLSAELMLVRRILERINEQMGLMGEDAPAHMAAPIENLKEKEKELVEKRDEFLVEWGKSNEPAKPSEN
ncbi:hypothetical protein CC1G_07584 [Coprinopsis cinerea okayama7|uniref:Uncharacterized protein n=1 Tax=Coprinopsis cinerea (strain Okayama-7 / 130 / ATCC MYA-4618 / FGSC 9003) TaxID=240176 RepID=A8NUP4_COPC7|nr:hypothetical protein CC1G_07584 [Coprinopsis cinerea okayama7\|eukprot:XP_001836501.1 hypothetical protein CC1G_07584 [Coprinopsis cinerea okayama7\